jgi:hypothetical protein
MTWMLLDEAGNAIAAYDDEVTAHAAMRSLAESEPDTVDSVLLIRYDDEGLPVGDAVTVADLPVQTVNILTSATDVFVLLSRATTGFGGVGQSVRVAARPTHVSTAPAPGPTVPA